MNSINENENVNVKKSKPLIFVDYNLSLSDIKENEIYISILNKIIKDIIKIHGFCSLKLLIKTVHTVCDELEDFCNKNEDKFKITSLKDKGLIGKIVEFYLFGNLPNNDSCPDMCYGDIKTTHFKNIGINSPNTFNAKERLTLTNFGDPSKQSNIDLISDKNLLQETKFYDKINKGIILIFQHDSSKKFENIENYYDKKIMGIVFYNLNDIFINHIDVLNIFKNDFDKIKKCIVDKNVSQCGQQYLHIHKHGCKLGLTRAFGFTNKFLTKLVSIYLNVQLITKGRSEFIEF
jgi:hypothetical protein